MCRWSLVLRTKCGLRRGKIAHAPRARGHPQRLIGCTLRCAAFLPIALHRVVCCDRSGGAASESGGSMAASSPALCFVRVLLCVVFARLLCVCVLVSCVLRSTVRQCTASVCGRERGNSGTRAQHRCTAAPPARHTRKDKHSDDQPSLCSLRPLRSWTDLSSRRAAASPGCPPRSASCSDTRDAWRRGEHNCSALHPPPPRRPCACSLPLLLAL